MNTRIPPGTLNRLLDQHAAREANDTIQSITGARPGPHTTKRGGEGTERHHAEKLLARLINETDFVDFGHVNEKAFLAIDGLLELTEDELTYVVGLEGVG